MAFLHKRNASFLVQLFLLSFFFMLILLSCLWLQRKFGLPSLEAIFFHINLQVPLVGAAPQELVASYIKRIRASFFVASGCTLIGVYLLWKFPCYQAKIRNSLRTLALAFFLCSLFVLNKSYGVYEYFKLRHTESSFIKDNYVGYTGRNIHFPIEKRNVIVLIMESMEETFYDETLFPESLIPYLNSLQDTNNATLLHKGANLDWTSAGITGFLFGLPLILPIDASSYQGPSTPFLPGAISLLEVFEHNGYTIAFIAGSDISFAGKRNLFTTHSQQPRIYDLPYFEPQLEEAGISLRSSWGMDDKVLYEQARTIITDIAQEERPFFVMMLTVDTHNRAESHGDYPQLYGDERDSFVAADYMVEEFLTWLVEQNFYSNTTVLIVGDHDYMNTKLGPVELNTRRRLYNVFLNTVFESDPNIRQRQATMLDMGASLLESIGVYLPQGRFGLGASIFSDTQTLTERYGLEELTAALRMRSLLYEEFLYGARASTLIASDDEDTPEENLRSDLPMLIQPQ